MEGEALRNIKKCSLLGVWGVFLCCAIFITPLRAQAATLFALPSEKTVTVGEEFSIGVFVSSPDKPMNAVSGVFSVPTDKLEILSLSKLNGIVGLWIEEPSSVVSTGKVSFRGVVLNPGYQGSAGSILTLRVRAKAVGTSVLGFDSAAILANDGLGTNILTGTARSVYVVTNAVETVKPETPIEESPSATSTPSVPTGEEEIQPPPVVEPPSKQAVPSLPAIVSKTHPNSNVWYQSKNAEFSWKIPSDVTSIRVLADQSPRTSPSILHTPAIPSINLRDLEDGVWYIHAGFKNQVGWGGSMHYKFQIDSSPPSDLQVEEVVRVNASDVPVAFMISAKDATSGIGRYGIQVDGGTEIEWRDDGSHQYTVENVLSGNHVFGVCAYDLAGNKTCAKREFKIGSFVSTGITITSTLDKEGMLRIDGRVDRPSVNVLLWIQRDGLEPVPIAIPSNEQGVFSYQINEDLEGGTYKIWAEYSEEGISAISNFERIVIKARSISTAGWLCWLLIVLVALFVLLLWIIFKRERHFMLMMRAFESGDRRLLEEAPKRSPVRVQVVGNAGSKRLMKRKRIELEDRQD